MKDKFYADNRDIVKWGGIVHLCKVNGIKTVVQVAYYREDKISFDDEDIDLRKVVMEHFERKDILDIKRLGTRAKLDIQVLKKEFKNKKDDRKEYYDEVCKEIEKINKKKVVFLDPDKGLEPKSGCTDEHVKPNEVKRIWQSLVQGDILVFYQCKPRGSKKGWKEDYRCDFFNRCGLKGIRLEDVRTWLAKEIAGDVVFYFIER
jgi:hypothetical protein